LDFVEDGSSYCLVTPTAPTAGSVQAELIAWLQEMGT
jgi:hypothetical protein